MKLKQPAVSPHATVVVMPLVSLIARAELRYDPKQMNVLAGKWRMSKSKSFFSAFCLLDEWVVRPSRTTTGRKLKVS
eukprot:5736292-Amphidinium_carterae.1